MAQRRRFVDVLGSWVLSGLQEFLANPAARPSCDNYVYIQDDPDFVIVVANVAFGASLDLLVWGSALSVCVSMRIVVFVILCI